MIMDTNSFQKCSSQLLKLGWPINDVVSVSHTCTTFRGCSAKLWLIHSKVSVVYVIGYISGCRRCSENIVLKHSLCSTWYWLLTLQNLVFYHRICPTRVWSCCTLVPTTPPVWTPRWSSGRRSLASRRYAHVTSEKFTEWRQYTFSIYITIKFFHCCWELSLCPIVRKHD